MWSYAEDALVLMLLVTEPSVQGVRGLDTKRKLRNSSLWLDIPYFILLQNDIAKKLGIDEMKTL